MNDNTYDQGTMQKIGPIRWMAPEQLESHRYSKASDVFAFGVLLYEIFAREMAWPNVPDTKVVILVSQKKRMEVPDKVPPAVRQLMDDCWAHRKSKRPTAEQVRERLRALVDDLEGSYNDGSYNDEGAAGSASSASASAPPEGCGAVPY